MNWWVCSVDYKGTILQSTWSHSPFQEPKYTSININGKEMTSPLSVLKVILFDEYIYFNNNYTNTKIF